MRPTISSWAALAAATTALAVPAAAPGPAGAAVAARPPVSVPIIILRGSGGQALALAPITLNGKRLIFVVDTGATGSLIDKRVARRLHLPKVGPLQRFKGVSCGGSAQPVRVAHWSVGVVGLAPQRLSSTRFSFGKGGVVVGLLGADVLSSFGKVSIDFTHSVMTLGG
jgi:predicted aspartyl protease